jgi:hypothetical protein
MKKFSKYFSLSLLAAATLLSGVPSAWAQVSLGKASPFAILAGTAVTCTNSTITGDVGVFPGTAVTQTSCTINGTIHAGDGVAKQASSDFLSAYARYADIACTGSLDAAYTGTTLTLTPGVYCSTAGVTFTDTTLTLDAQGNANAVWIFKIGTSGTGALTGTNFSVVMAGGGQPCNVTWWVAQAATMTTSSFQGTILAGAAITVTGLAGSKTPFNGDAFAKAAVTLTDVTVTSCKAASGGPRGGAKSKCNQGVGNGPESCDPGNSNQGNPLRSNDELGGTPGNPGRKGGKK